MRSADGEVPKPLFEVGLVVDRAVFSFARVVRIIRVVGVVSVGVEGEADEDGVVVGVPILIALTAACVDMIDIGAFDLGFQGAVGKSMVNEFVAAVVVGVGVRIVLKEHLGVSCVEEYLERALGDGAVEVSHDEDIGVVGDDIEFVEQVVGVALAVGVGVVVAALFGFEVVHREDKALAGADFLKGLDTHAVAVLIRVCAAGKVVAVGFDLVGAVDEGGLGVGSAVLRVSDIRIARGARGIVEGLGEVGDGGRLSLYLADGVDVGVEVEESTDDTVGLAVESAVLAVEDFVQLRGVGYIVVAEVLRADHEAAVAEVRVSDCGVCSETDGADEQEKEEGFFHDWYG